MESMEITPEELQQKKAASRNSKWEGRLCVLLEALCLVLIVAFGFRK
jgi:hypothetical protein